MDQRALSAPSIAAPLLPAIHTCQAGPGALPPAIHTCHPHLPSTPAFHTCQGPPLAARRAPTRPAHVPPARHAPHPPKSRPPPRSSAQGRRTSHLLRAGRRRRRVLPQGPPHRSAAGPAPSVVLTQHAPSLARGQGPGGLRARLLAMRRHLRGRRAATRSPSRRCLSPRVRRCCSRRSRQPHHAAGRCPCLCRKRMASTEEPMRMPSPQPMRTRLSGRVPCTAGRSAASRRMPCPAATTPAGAAASLDKRTAR